MSEHVVRLPHPDRQELTFGHCDCGWFITYGWGEHGEAEDAATEHVEQEALAEAITTRTMAGDRTVMPGVSL